MAPLTNHHRCNTPIDRDGPDGVVGLTPMLDEVLPNCVERLNEALRIVDRSQLALLAQQISVEGTQRGLCDISHCASRVEQAVLAAQCECSRLTEQVEELISLCRRAAASGLGDTELPNRERAAD